MLKFIDNVGDYFTTNYFDEDFAKRVLEKSGYAADDYKGFNQKISGLKDRYYKYKQQLLEGRLRTKDKIAATHDFHTLVLNALGYDGSHPEYNHLWHLSEHEVVPVRHTLYRGEQPHLMVLEMQPLIPEGDEVPDGLFEQRYNVEDEEEGSIPAGSLPQRYHRSQWDKVFQVPEGLKISPVIVNKMISTLFLLKQEERSRYILLLAGNVIFLLEQEKWFRGSYLRFDLEELFSEAVATTATRNYYSLLYFLLAKETLSPDGDMVLLDQLDEDSHRSAYEVTKDLKEGIIGAVEALANEAVWYWKNQLHQNLDETEDQFEHDLKDDCLTIIYRLLFIFYAESRQDLTILPTADGTYQKGYSLEMLRDLEQVPLHSDTSRNGYFFHESLATLFGLLHRGYRENENGSNKSFRVRHLDSPLFNNDKLKQLAGVKFRNSVWQGIICRLSLSREQKGRSRGRISYANLGINQLGSVYESLLAYRGFFTEGEYIEVHKAGKPEEGTYLVPRSRLDDFREEEILHDADHRLVVIPKGTFLYRLSGRDRQQSASYYTPEVLTRCTVKYTLQPLLARLDLPAADKNRLTALDLLDLKLLEPAMGAAAFHNELINQLAEAYLSRRQEELKRRVAPDQYQEELQKVKAFIATTNVYGVDLNPTAIELGKLSLWLNVIHRDMETPFFGNRLAVGNAVVGAWLRVYPESAVSEEFALTAIGRPGKTPVKKEWWEQAPRPLRFGKGKGPDRKPTELYHFLLPDKNMVASAGAKLLKDRHPAEAKRVSEMRKGWVAPLTPTELRQVRGLSAKVDELLREYYQFQRSIRTHTGAHLHVWGGLEESQPGAQLGFKTYDEKERLNDQRHRHGAPYFKLKMLMDYWCALWFWDVRQAVDLPTRQQYWDDLSSIVQLDLNAPVPAPVVRSMAPAPQLAMFGGGGQQLPLLSVVAEPELADTPELGEEAIIAYTNRRGLFDDNQRLRLVRSLAAQHRFFHPQLEFLEVFWERGGFDLLAGNPPWLKVKFIEQEIIGESFPEVLIQEISATDVSHLRDKFLENKSHEEIYFQELVDATASAEFLQATQNYPLLYGQQTNLYKCVIENGFSLLAPEGFMGLVHPEGVFDDPKGQILRQALYSRLKFHFQFKNELSLFAEVGHKKMFSASVYSGTKKRVDFLSMNNLFAPATVDASLVHNGYGEVGGYKVFDKATNKNVWNILPHKSRVIRITEQELRILALVFETSTEWQNTKLVSIHSTFILSILEKLSQFQNKANKDEGKFTLCWHETNAQKDGILKKTTRYPSYDDFEMIYGGPHFFVANPLYKSPRRLCIQSSNYDTVLLNFCDDKYLSRTNFIPLDKGISFPDSHPGFIVGYEEANAIGYSKPVYDSWFNYFKLFLSGQVDPVTERTLQSAILPPKASHLNTVISVAFRDTNLLVEFAGLTASLVMDFYLKTTGVPQLNKSTLENFPLGIAARYKPALFARTLLLNCVNKYYAPLWASQWQTNFQQQAWSSVDTRLKPFAELGPEWEQDTPLRNWLERRQALVEIDVLSAQALGITLAELELLYLVQFPVLQQNEDDTWYDQHGNIVFTCSKGLNGVGLDRADWEAIRELPSGKIYEHTITKSELYHGQKVTYYAPFEKRDRVADYRVAWAHFEATLPTD